MVIKDVLPSGLLEATRLTRAGRLVEATALIQRHLRREPISEAPVEDAPPARVIDAAFTTLQEPIQTPRHGKPGGFITGSYTSPAGTRPYKLYIPTAYRGKALPLIVLLHGCTQTPDDFAAGT